MKRHTPNRSSGHLGKSGRRAPAAAILGAVLGCAGHDLPANAAEPSSRADLDGVRNYHIAPGSLASALNRFAEASGQQLVYDSGLTRGLTTPGISGPYTASEALQKLLAGSGLSFRHSGKGPSPSRRCRFPCLPRKRPIRRPWPR